MNAKEKKAHVNELVEDNINHYFSLLDDRFKPEFDKLYIQEILRFSKAFNYRLTREQKLKFCKNCLIYWSVDTREIRLNATFRTKEFICKNCGFVRRYKYD